MAEVPPPMRPSHLGNSTLFRGHQLCVFSRMLKTREFNVAELQSKGV